MVQYVVTQKVASVVLNHKAIHIYIRDLLRSANPSPSPRLFFQTSVDRTKGYNIPCDIYYFLTCFLFSFLHSKMSYYGNHEEENGFAADVRFTFF